MKKIQFNTFIQTYPESLSAATENNVICFQADAYPMLFLSFFVEKISHFLRIFPEQVAVDELFCTWGTSFLGQSQTYWLGDVSELEKKKKDTILTYLASYQGPHTIIFFISTKDLWKSKKGTVIVLDNVVSIDIIKSLAIMLLLPAQVPRVLSFMKKVLNAMPTISLDQSVLFFRYALVLGSRTDDFIHNFLTKIATPESSLFMLSQYFFKRNVEQFYQLWQRVESDYPETFWIVFWSEQLWRAHYFLSLREHHLADAKRIAFRLPFSFIQRDWRQVTRHELRGAHQWLYHMDVALKNGALGSFDLFFAKFFAHQF